MIHEFSSSPLRCVLSDILRPFDRPCSALRHTPQVVFDLVDHDKLPPDNGTYRVRKHTKFCDFKTDLSKQVCGAG